MAVPDPPPTPTPIRSISSRTIEVTGPVLPADADSLEVMAREPGSDTFYTIWTSDGNTEPKPLGYGYFGSAPPGGHVVEFKTRATNGDGFTDSESVTGMTLPAPQPPQVTGWDGGTNTVTAMVTLPAWNSNTSYEGSPVNPAVVRWVFTDGPTEYFGTESSGIIVGSFIWSPGSGEFEVQIAYTDAYDADDGSSASYSLGAPLPPPGQAPPPGNCITCPPAAGATPTCWCQK